MAYPESSNREPRICRRVVEYGVQHQIRLEYWEANPFQRLVNLGGSVLVPESEQMQDSVPNPHALAISGQEATRHVMEVAFDPTSTNSPPWSPQFEFMNLAQRLWRQRWLWALSQVEGLDPISRDFVHWVLASAAPAAGPALEAARHAVTPDQIDWQAAADAYVQQRNAQLELHIIWPLDLGGVVLAHAPFVLGNAVRFIPAEISEGAEDGTMCNPNAIVHELQRLAPGFMARPPLYHETAIGAWIHCRPDDDALGDVGPWPGRWHAAQTHLFLALSALRLAAPGLLTSPYSLFMPAPVFWGLDAAEAYGDPPHGRPFGTTHLWTSWPGGVGLESVLRGADLIFTDLLSMPWLAKGKLVEPGVTVRPGPTTSYVYRPAQYLPRSYLEFALYMLDVSYSRRTTEAVVDLWALMEALFLLPNDPRRGASDIVGRRAAVLLDHDVKARRATRKSVEHFAAARSRLTHGREVERPLLSTDLAEYYELARRSLAAVIRLAATVTRQGGDASDKAAVLAYLQSLT